MGKWIIRLIGISFLFGALLNLFGLITGINPPHGFLGLSWVSPSAQFDIMAWVGVCVIAYIGYRLVRLHPQGRLWALIVLWYTILGFGLTFVYSAIKAPIPLTSIAVTVNFLGHSYKLNKPGSYLILSGIVFLLYATQIYFLMRKDVKMEFQKQETSEVKPATE
jgi:hypothetical protein